MKRIVLILATIIILGIAIVAGLVVWFIYTDFWKYNADFDGHRDEFLLVRDYILEEKFDESGLFYVSYDSEHYFDLYDTSSKQYMNCPEEVKTALEELSRNAFTNKDAVFATIRCKQNVISFFIESNHYALVYSPNGEPSNILDTESEVSVVCKKIEEGWYHVRIE